MRLGYFRHLLPIHLFAFIASIGLLAVGCDNVTDNSNIVFPEKNISYQSHVEPFMRTTCAYQGCHSTETAAGGRRMAEYFDLTSTANVGLIVDGKPDDSILIKFLEYKIYHSFNVYYKVNDNQLKGMKQWILEGAKFN